MTLTTPDLTLAQVVGTYELAVEDDEEGSKPWKETYAMVRPAATHEPGGMSRYVVVPPAGATR